MAGGVWGDGPRGGIFGARIDPALLRELEKRAEAQRRIAEAHAAAEGMQEPSRALYEAKHRRAQEGYEPPSEPSFLENVASLGPRAVGGAQKMAAAAPRALEALVRDPLGSVNRAGLAGQAATDAIVQGAVKPFTQFNRGDVDPVEQAADLAGTVMLGSAAIPAEANALRMGIKAYHGSPHDFDQFDASKIGTGEGAQAYGHGLYFAEREGVATDYRNKLGGGRTEVTNPATQARETLDYDQWHDTLPDLVKAVDPKINPQTTAQKIKNAVVDAKNDGVPVLQAFDDAAAKKIEALRRSKNPDHIIEYERQANTRIRSVLEQLNPQHKNVGSMYEVDIAAEPEQFLDWDKPLSEQPQSLQDLARNADLSSVPTRLRRKIEAWRGEYTPPEGLVVDEPTGNEIHSALTDFGTDSSRNAGLSQKLREAGIPGIRYLDQGSRMNLANLPKNPMTDEALKWLEAHGNDADAAVKAFQQHQRDTGYKDWNTTERDEIANVIRKSVQPSTRNYVIFPGNEHLISVLKKYGLPISAAGLAALHELHPEEAQAAEQKARKK